MKKIVKITSGLLVILLTLACFAACQPKVTPDSDDSDSASRTQGIDFSVEIGNVIDYSVVVAVNASDTEIYAAEQLVSYIEQVTDVQIPYIADGSFADSKVISVGRTVFFESSQIQADDELGTDGFVMKSKGSALLICGGGDRGTLYGVYDFLEYVLGIKFLTSDYTYIPKNADAKVYNCDRTEIPAFEYRVYLDSAAYYNVSTELSTTRRFTSEYLNLSESVGGNLKWYQGYETHNSTQWANIEEHIKDGKLDPAYFGAFANDGVDTVTSDTYGGLWVYASDLCYTDGINDDGTYQTETVNADGTTRKTAIGLVIDGMEEVILNDSSQSNYYMFGQADFESRQCLCSKCRAASQKYTDSGILLRFINALSDAIEQFVSEEKIQREINIVTFAYHWSSSAPVTEQNDGTYTAIDPTVVPNDNVTIRIAPIKMNRFITYSNEYNDNNEYGSDYMKKWSALTDNFMVWDYVTDYGKYYWWYPTMPAWHDKLVELKQMGVSYVMLQSNYEESTVYQTTLESYVASKMLWNPDYNINEIISEFNRYYFGEIGGECADNFVNLMTVACYEALEQNDYSTAVTDEYFTKGLLTTVLDSIDSAIEQTEQSSELTDEQKQEYVSHLEILAFQPRYMYLYNYMQYESDSVQMNVLAKQLILDIMLKGGAHYGESDTRLFDLENVVFK